MMSAPPFWMMVTFPSARARDGQSVLGSALSSIPYNQQLALILFQSIRPWAGWEERATHHGLAETLELHNVGREDDPRNTLPALDDVWLILTPISLGRPYDCSESKRAD